MWIFRIFIRFGEDIIAGFMYLYRLYVSLIEFFTDTVEILFSFKALKGALNRFFNDFYDTCIRALPVTTVFSFTLGAIVISHVSPLFQTYFVRLFVREFSPLLVLGFTLVRVAIPTILYHRELLKSGVASSEAQASDYWVFQVTTFVLLLLFYTGGFLGGYFFQQLAFIDFYQSIMRRLSSTDILASVIKTFMMSTFLAAQVLMEGKRNREITDIRLFLMLFIIRHAYLWLFLYLLISIAFVYMKF